MVANLSTGIVGHTQKEKDPVSKTKQKPTHIHTNLILAVFLYLGLLC